MMQDKNKAVSRIAAVTPLPKIREILVVEGRDDTAAIKKSVDAITIETHGYGITNKTWKLIEEAYNGPGIIVFTDPDHAGEQIRRRIMEKFPEARQAFLDRKAATKKGDIGIENADPESIREALRKAHGSFDAKPAAPVFCRKICWMQGSSDKPTRQREEKNWKDPGDRLWQREGHAAAAQQLWNRKRRLRTGGSGVIDEIICPLDYRGNQGKTQVSALEEPGTEFYYG